MARLCFCVLLSYQLQSLAEVEQYIQQHHHLPDVPAAAEVESNGFELGEMDAALLRKIEELTLHLIALEKQNVALQARVHQLETAPR